MPGHVSVLLDIGRSRGWRPPRTGSTATPEADRCDKYAITAEIPGPPSHLPLAATSRLMARDYSLRKANGRKEQRRTLAQTGAAPHAASASAQTRSLGSQQIAGIRLGVVMHKHTAGRCPSGLTGSFAASNGKSQNRYSAAFAGFDGIPSRRGKRVGSSHRVPVRSTSQPASSKAVASAFSCPAVPSRWM